MIFRILDIFFVVFHTTIILFNLFGWIWKKTRFANLVTLLLTAGSWLFLGLLVGSLGYCPLTDWHFNVLRKLGNTDLPNSYVKYLIDRLTGLDLGSSLVDNITLWSLVIALGASIFLNGRRFLRKKAEA